MGKRTGFTLVELVAAIAIVLVLVTMVAVALGGQNSRTCMYNHLREWGALIKQARAMTIQNNAVSWVRLEQPVGDGIPTIRGVLDRAKAGYNPLDRYRLAIGNTTDAATGATDPADASCGTVSINGINMIETTALPPFPPELDPNGLGVLPTFADDQFAFLPDGTVVDRNGNASSGAFAFVYNNAEGTAINFGLLYVLVSGDIRMYFLGSGLADAWGQIE